MPTELQLLQRRAKYLGLKATGTREELLRRISRSEGITRDAVLQIIRRDLAKMMGKPAKAKAKAKVKAKAADYRKVKLTDEEELIMTYCGEQCFAGGRAICSNCDSKKCYCEPKCSMVRNALNKGIERDRMKYYADVLNCVRFQVGDIVVHADKGTFAIVDQVLDNEHAIKITQLEHKDYELMSVLQRGHNEGYQFTAEEILDFDNRYAVRPTWKEVKRGQSKVNAEQYELYDETKIYYKEYSLKEIRALLNYH